MQGAYFYKASTLRRITHIKLFLILEISALVEEVNVLFDGLFYIGESFVVAGCEEVREIGFSEILVFPFQNFREVNVLDLAFAHGLDDGICYFIVALRMARAAVVDAGGPFVLPEPEVHFDDVFDVDEVAALLAVAYRFSLNVAPATEEAGFAGGVDLVIELVVNGGHLAFVVFLRAVDVEVFEADDLTLGFRHDLTDIAVEGELGEGVGIQRVFAFVAFAEAVFTAAVGGGGGGVHHGDAVTQAEVQKSLGIFVVRAHHVVHVVDHGVGAGAFMENNVDVSAVEAVALDGFEKIVLVLVVEEFEPAKVFVVEAVFQVVNDQDVAASLTVQCFDNVAADESGTTCDNNHMCVPPCIVTRDLGN